MFPGALLLLLAGFGSDGAVAAGHAVDTPDRVAVVVATRRDHHVVFFRGDSLSPLGSLTVNNLASHVSASADSDELFIAAAQSKAGNNCCALFALNLRDRSMCQLIYPALQSTPSPSRNEVYVQRGNTGIEGFHADSLAKLPTIRAPGVYHLLPSGEGKWLFGITSFEGPSLDIFSLPAGRMIRRLPLPKHRAWDGAWVGREFYLFSQDGRRGQLWTVDPEETEKGPQFCKRSDTCADRPVSLPDLGNRGRPVGMAVIGAGNFLFAYEPLGWWFKLDRRSEQHTPFPGGIFKIDPVSGKLLAHLLPKIDFAQVTSDAEGRYLYAVDAGSGAATGSVRLLKLDSGTGEILAAEILSRDVWWITTASLALELIPAGDVVPSTCAR